MKRALILSAVACAMCACLYLATAQNAPADIILDPPPREERAGLSLRMSAAGATVVNVRAPQAFPGIRRGDLILAVDRVYIRALTRAARNTFASGHRTQPVAVLLVRNGRDVLEVRAPANPSS